ncbi:hypothetical protein GW626_15775 [Peribacillus muralis]|uniref:hypothetical protein n=1 Tax=Peribacillus muralis TaxID=264697 RepID=UPI001F4E065C|nr:hypothetical protein [Peribacillus muralis]MCK1991808.1 hypothetical protein [Peribacillus muralis]MCK2012366.1 hypothetical protein [Peribacillus muralis]
MTAFFHPFGAFLAYFTTLLASSALLLANLSTLLASLAFGSNLRTFLIKIVLFTCFLYRFSSATGGQSGIPLFQSGAERKATRLLREMRVYVRRRRLKAEEAYGPPLDKEATALERND